MKVFAFFLKWFSRIWMAIVLLSVPASWVGLYLGNHSLWQTWLQIREMLDPWSFPSLYTTVILFSLPAVGAELLRTKLEKKKSA